MVPPKICTAVLYVNLCDSWLNRVLAVACITANLYTCIALCGLEIDGAGFSFEKHKEGEGRTAFTEDNCIDPQYSTAKWYFHYVQLHSIHPPRTS